jgi:trans-2,3-dihydro-3-hydroxyanthranilate isomerase
LEQPLPRRYAILDVFADRPLAGNPLAVVLDSDGLDTTRMQAIAREFNLSETVFVSPAVNPVHTASLRIFTPGRELPFAGHPTVGTASLLAMRRVAGAAGRHEMVLVLEEKVGPVRCGVTVTSDRSARAIFDVPVIAKEAGPGLDRDAVAAALGLARLEVGFENHQPSVFSAGVAMNYVPVRDLAVIARAQPMPALWEAAFGKGAVGAYLYCRETMVAGHHFHARMFAPGSGISEDPATGLAASALVGVIRRFDGPPAGSHHFVIEQGFEMGRPSLMSLEMDLDRGEVVGARVGGDAVRIAEGELDV